MIPKRAMFFWSGAPLTWARWLTLRSFRHFNPDWEMILFVTAQQPGDASWSTGERLEFMQPGGITAADLLPTVKDIGVQVRAWNPPAPYVGRTPAQWADMCRWGALSEFGGWFFDMDTLFLDSMDVLPHDRTADVAFIACQDWLPTGFIGASKGCEFTASVYSAALESPDKSRFRAAGSETILRMIGLFGNLYYKPANVQFRLRTAFPQLGWQFLPMRTAYRWQWYDGNQIFGADQTVFADTVAIHWYGASRAGQKYSRLLDGQNYVTFENAFCHYASDIIRGNTEIQAE